MEVVGESISFCIKFISLGKRKDIISADLGFHPELYASSAGSCEWNQTFILFTWVELQYCLIELESMESYGKIHSKEAEYKIACSLKATQSVCKWRIEKKKSDVLRNNYENCWQKMLD